MNKFKKAQAHRKPEGEVRQSQLITTFGPGSMMDLLDHAVLIGGLDFWCYDKSRLPGAVINEPRLRDALVAGFQAAGQELSHEAFRKPPVANDESKVAQLGVPVLEFPRWFVCQNPECRAVVRHDHGLEFERGHYYHRCDKSRTPHISVPVRFVGACKRGHIDDFPWIAFVHELQGIERCAGVPQLRLLEDATGDFSGIRVACHCEAPPVRLSTAMGGVKITCRGRRPWLGSGPDIDETCDADLRLLVRTASNSYFAQVVSALSVPEAGKEIEEAIQEHWATLQVATAETLPAFLTVPKIKDSVGRFKTTELLKTIERLKRGTGGERLPLRTAEFKQLSSAPPEAAGDMPTREETFFARELPMKTRPFGVARVVLASKLREVRAQIGFTRLEPVSADLQGEFDLGVESARLSLTADWLPATEVSGEGVFLQLDEAAVRQWESRPEVAKRTQALQAGHDAWLHANKGHGVFPGARFYLLHSLSHLLITAISLECGYSASAIRERIYCGPSATDSTPMAAILLSTGSTGAEGTLGGLVEQGRRMREHLGRAFDSGRLCSSDPVCAAHSPAEDRAERFLEGAACHGCLFVSEPSCERYNRYLDRALVVPCLGHDSSLAFFSERP